MEPLSQIKNSFSTLAANKHSTVIARAGKWTVYFIMIGLIAGLGSIVFHYLCQLGVHYFMDVMAGYRPPARPASTT